MVQIKDVHISQKKTDALRTGGIKVSFKSPRKIKSAGKVQYASLPGRFKVQPRGSSLLVAQAHKGGKSTKTGRCIPGIAKAPPKRKVRRLTSNVKLKTSKLYYSLRLRSNGVDAIIQQGGQLYRAPLDVKASWDAKKKKVIIDGKTLKSSKLVNTILGRRLQFDKKELAKLVKPQMDVLVYEINNRIRSSGIAGLKGRLKTIDGVLAKLKERLKRSFKKDRSVRAARRLLMKRHGLLKAHLKSLIKQRKKIARLMKRRKGFTKSFRKKLTLVKRQTAKLIGRIAVLRSKLWKIIYKHWLKVKRKRKRKC